MNKSSTKTLVMVREVNASREQVFKAWVSPAMMKKWFFTTEKTNKLVENDPRLGGAWQVIDERNGKTYKAVGNYLVFEEPNRLVLSFKMPQFGDTEDRITVELKPLAQGSKLTFTQEIVVVHEAGWNDAEVLLAEEEALEASEQGWTFMLDGLRQLVETGKVGSIG